MLRRGQHLQRESGAVHRFAPAPLVVGSSNPSAPEIHGFFERLGNKVRREGWGFASRLSRFQNESCSFPSVQREFGCGVAVHNLQRHADAEAQGDSVRAVRGENKLVVAGFDSMTGASVIESRGEQDTKPNFTAHCLCPSHQRMSLPYTLDRHEIGNLSDAVA